MREEQKKTVLDRSIGIDSSHAFYFSPANGEILKELLDTGKPCQTKGQDRNRLSAKNTRTTSKDRSISIRYLTCDRLNACELKES